ncbi:MAG: NAD(P)/FAD-dependent oxidoreductase [Nanoarchaeota archaeon]|nr:NAD(P)/FAD-dependent oxidoreductase [Nanoarchaeota archaeon]
MNIAVIGAGPIGCYAASLLAKHGHQVSVYENHAQIGLPIQCTGLLTSDFDQFKLPMESFLVNTFENVEVYSPHQKLEVKQKEYLVCRNKFDNFFGNLAKKEGVTVYLNHSFLRKEGNELIIKDSIQNVEKRITPDIVIASDGPLSPTAKAYGLYHPQRENYYGIQAIVEGHFDPASFKTYFGEKVCPELFAWIVPESSTIARVGLAMRKNSRAYFDKFMAEHGFTVKEMQAGTIPVYHPAQQLQKENCYLLGDAAGFVKATTLGGLVPGLRQAEIVVDCISNHKNYQQEVQPLAKKLKLHLLVRRILDKFSDRDWDTLVSYINQPKVQKVFEKYTRDNPIPLVMMALIKEPRFLRFGKYLV